jgi:hypothetical protein
MAAWPHAVHAATYLPATSTRCCRNSAINAACARVSNAKPRSSIRAAAGSADIWIS